MAAAVVIDAGDAGTELVPLELIAVIVRKTCAKYGWDKRDSTHKTFLKHLKHFASDVGLTLDDIAKSSEIYAKNLNYSSIPVFNRNKVLQLMRRFQNIPYTIYVDDNNITNVVIRKGNVECPITEITKDMMQMLSYLGVVRVYVSCECELVIPCWTDNIVHLEINQERVIRHLDEAQIPFPKYLQVMVDTTKFVGKYINWLPETLTTLVSACIQLHNISSNLQNYTYTENFLNDALAQAEYLPIGIKNVIYNYSPLNQQDITVCEITMPPGTQYLELGFTRLCADRLIIKSIKRLHVKNFKTLIPKFSIKDAEMVGTNLTLEYPQCCSQCCRILRQNLEVILEEGLEHLIIDMFNFIPYDNMLLESIKEVPASLTHITIYADDNFIYKYKHPMEFLNKDRELLHSEELEIVIIFEFIKRFPHIKVSIELEPLP